MRLQMERTIDKLAEIARSDIDPGQFFAEVLRLAVQPGGAQSACLWRKSIEDGWEPAGESPSIGIANNGQIENHQQLLNEVAQDPHPRVVASQADQPGQSPSIRVYSPLRHSGVTVGILESDYPISTDDNLSVATYQFLAALSEITADFLSQQELLQLRKAKLAWLQWDQYQIRISRNLDLATVCAVIANDGRIIVGCDRVSVLIRRGRAFFVNSISGVEQADPRAGAVQALEALGNLVRSNLDGYWTTSPAEDPPITQYMRASGTSGVGVIPLRSDAESERDFPPQAVIVFDNFEPHEHWSEIKPRAEALVVRSAPILRMAIERSEIPGLTLWLRLRRIRHIVRHPALIGSLAAFFLIVILLVLVPAEFTVTASGELLPAVRREIFASSTGIVDQVMVSHGDEVRVGQPLIVLRDLELEQEAPKILGEIATTTQRLRGVQIARLKGRDGTDLSGQHRQLTADEEELKAKLKALELHRDLILERQSALNLLSPISGQVLTWDVSQHLTARPVERGQSLLTIGETGGDWILELIVSDKDAGHVLRARNRDGGDLTVDFQLPAEPGRSYQGKIRSVSLTSISNERASGYLQVIVDLDKSQLDRLRPGATVTSRIRCGRQASGYVWLHDLIDFVRIRLLF